VSDKGATLDAATQKATFEDYAKKGLVPYVFGEIGYLDAFGRRHWTHFCVVVRADFKSTGPCSVYNDSDPEIENRQPQTPTTPPAANIPKPCILTPWFSMHLSPVTIC